MHAGTCASYLTLSILAEMISANSTAMTDRLLPMLKHKCAENVATTYDTASERIGLLGKDKAKYHAWLTPTLEGMSHTNMQEEIRQKADDLLLSKPRIENSSTRRKLDFEMQLMACIALVSTVH